MRAFTLKVPASSGNIGAGFDVFGMALSIKNEFSFAAAKEYLITYTGETQNMEASFSDPNKNYLIKCYQACCKKLEMPEHPFSLRASLRVPSYSGLGTSAIASIAAATAALVFNNLQITKEKLLNLSMILEQHPDNIAPSLWGGFTVSILDPDTNKYKAYNTSVDSALICRLLLPNLTTSTQHVRGTMPTSFSRAAAVANLGYAGLTALAFGTRNYSLLRYGMNDQIHEHHRDKPELGYAKLKSRLIDAGALGVCLSGSGPAILVLTQDNQRLDEKFEEAIAQHFQKHKLKYRDLPLRVNNLGMQIQYES